MRGARLLFMAFAIAAAGCSRESYSIVARLGHDTISIERITRRGKTVTSDVAERSPRAQRKHWEATVNSDGSVRRFTMETRLLNPAPDEAPLVTTSYEFGDDSVRVTVLSGDRAERSAVPAEQHVNAPWNPYVYGTYELLFAAAARVPSDSVRIHQLVPGFGRGNGVIRKRPDGTMTLVSTRLSGTGIGTLDENGRLLSYDGRNTTYKQLVERGADQPDIDAIAARFAGYEKAAPGGWLSPRDTTQATLGAATITVEYSRPLARGRTLVGDVIPYDRVWRTGANAATQLTTNAPISIAGTRLDAGAYTLFTLPTRDSVLLIINRQTGQWGTSYRGAMDIARTRLTVDTIAAPVEAFTIGIEPNDSNTATLTMQWGTFRWSAPIVVR